MDLLQKGALSRPDALRHLPQTAASAAAEAQNALDKRGDPGSPIRGPYWPDSAIDRAIPTSQVKRSNRDIAASRCKPMAKSELGTKRVCPETGRKFYDLNKNPVVSPYTGKVVPVEAPPVSRARPEPVTAAPRTVPAEEVAVPEPAEAEFVSLEEADAEAQGGTSKKPVEPAEAEIEEDVEIDESLDDAAFIEEQEEEDTDVTDIIGGDIENEEET
jgi:uncharacterized protein (TIGR02300 family)